MNVPALRFPEFEGEWEEKRLGAFFEEFKSKSDEQDQHEVLTSARTGLVRQKDYYDNDRITDRDNVGFNVIPPDYLTYRSRSDDRKFFFNENKLGITGIISIYYPVFRIVNGDNNFFAELLARHSNHIGKFSVGTSQTVLSMNELKRIKLPIPKANEQKKVAVFLGVVDAKIAALRDRVAGLERYKRGLMQALFSQTLRFTKPDGSPFPDWEEKRLGDLLTVRYGKDHKGIPDGNIPVLGTGGIMRHVDRSLHDGPSVLIGRKGTIDKPRYVTEPFWTVDTLFYSDIKLGYLPFFAFLVVQSINWLKYNEATGVPSLSATAIHSVKVTVPPHPDEQAKIAEALSAMDAKIIAVAGQLEKMQDFKKGLLQQMFV